MTAIGDIASIAHWAPPKSWLYLTGRQWSVYDKDGLECFDAGMAHAIEAAEIGFYFEEGECWAMAAALHTVFSEKGNQGEMRYQAEDFGHAWAVVDGIAIDHQGVMLNEREGRPFADRNAMERLAAEHGIIVLPRPPAADEKGVSGRPQEVQDHQIGDGALITLLRPRPVEIGQRLEAADMRAAQSALKRAAVATAMRW